MKSVLTAVADYLLKRGVAAEQKKAGLAEAAIDLSFGRLAYLQRAASGPHRPEAVLMLHAATGDRSAWLRFARHLDPRFALVIPDLPGHGGSSAELHLDYSIGAQAGRIKELLCNLTVGRVHLVANSMGGAIALHLAATWPDLVRSLTLIGSAGVPTSPSWLQQYVARTGSNPMIDIALTADYRLMLGIGMHAPPYLPKMMLDALTRNFASRKAINQKICDDMLRDLDQTDKLAAIRARALIIWGAYDRVEHVDSAAMLQRCLASSERVVLDGVGHLAMLEAPRQVAVLCSSFFGRAAAPG